MAGKAGKDACRALTKVHAYAGWSPKLGRSTLRPYMRPESEASRQEACSRLETPNLIGRQGCLAPPSRM